MRYFNIFFLALSMSFLVSCSVLKHGLRGVPRALDDEYYIELAKKYKSSAFRHQYDEEEMKNEPDYKKLEKIRNKVLNELILLTDVYYRDYEDFLYVGKAMADTGFDVVELGLTLWATVSGVNRTKTTLSAIATGLKGTRLSIDKNLFQRQAMIAMISKMRAIRKEKLIVLYQGMKKPVLKYSLDQALIDIGEYYNAGTIIGALQDIFSQSGVEDKEAEKKLEEIKKSDK